jgi:PAS domain S-box-containing protein
MKKSLKKELFNNIAIMMCLIIIIVSAGIASVLIQKRNFKRIIVEYHEINAIYDLNYSLNKTAKSANKYLLQNNPEIKIEFQENVDELAIAYERCKTIITDRHSKEILTTIENGINKIISIGTIDKSKYNIDEQNIFYNRLDLILKKTDAEILIFQNETREEIEEYIDIDKKISKFSIILIILIGSIIIAGSLLWGLNFVKKRTSPIIKLIDFTRRISEGNFNIQADVRFGNELDSLTISFNQMLETLNHTTISKDYLNNIINSVVDVLIVTDPTGNMKLINSTTLKILGYEEYELLDKNVKLLFPGYESGTDFSGVFSLSQTNLNPDGEFVILTKDKRQIEVLLSTSLLKNTKDETVSFIIVAHDITEKNRIKNQLEIERKGRVAAIIEAQEEERLRLARDLHDGLGQQLTGIMYFVENNLTDKADEKGISQQNIGQLLKLITNAIKETKSIAHNIIPILLKDFGLAIAIKKLAAQLNSNNDFNIQISEFNFDSRLESKIEKILYRVCQEAFNNIIKHAQAKNINIQFIKHEHSVVLLIDDDGIGFETENAGFSSNFPGIGLITMKERVSALNGVFSITSQPDKGTEILIEIPC